MGRRLGCGGTTTTQVRDILVGTLVVDIADAKKGQLAWRGMGVKEVDTQAKPEKRDKSINNGDEEDLQELSAEAEDLRRHTAQPRGILVIRRLTSLLVLLHGVGRMAVQQSHRAATGQASEQQTKTLNLSAYAELLRSDVRAQKVAILTEVMGFTEAEDKAFWPIYRDYDADMAKLGDERVAMIAEYARNYSQMTDDLAGALVTKAVDLENRRTAALAACVDRVRDRVVATDGAASSSRSSTSCS